LLAVALGGCEVAGYGDSKARLLESVTGQTFGANPVRWSEWFEANQEYLFFDWQHFTIAIDASALRAKRAIAEDRLAAVGADP
jgi:hypothetical protein